MNVMCNHVSGAILNIGHTEVVCEAVDSSGNTGECKFNVTIKGMIRISPKVHFVLTLHSCSTHFMNSLFVTNGQNKRN